MSDAVSCSSCKACCCQLEVMLIAGDDDVPAEFIEVDAWGGEIMHRLADGWCAALNRSNMLCTIYAQRPWICREYEAGDSDCIEQRQRIPLLSIQRII
ncbi:YkgJ family cysteine cluster protein [Deefgea sp. CFH1-16]|uniref:YkgJ family cysteine cluster protein n=1 Tax=Deefgea sp. CFH1-16 TaxID=2675457 RepID=UPI0015F4F7EA|nr:YkgJ family cysteine cluster protein [Deefgea sp. CFH1-16]MBM5573699.1 YkgJ family cysteine cluster protein [Deefgea sp. CFH1-16]